MYIVNMASGCTQEGAVFVSLDDLDNISLLLGEENDFEEEITDLLNEVFFLFQSLKRNTTNQALNILKTCNKR